MLALERSVAQRVSFGVIGCIRHKGWGGRGAARVARYENLGDNCSTNGTFHSSGRERHILRRVFRALLSSFPKL